MEARSLAAEELRLARSRRKKTARKMLRSIGKHFILMLAGVCFLGPFAYLMLTSVKSMDDILPYRSYGGRKSCTGRTIPTPSTQYRFSNIR
ncbi:hypothetical protein PACILC2_48850 [Paenibacillus cisolokensis]|uniref:Sugar ABC transporter permease n=1 Tax=Paenibacillus cisolokensis TaxID=1658519 RepID=A0ABQ4NDK3_9BACL|nr:hypothetical protein [Paenibacillus cisolokensis]GIQ66317.1 hypothetical protein PACILC2_48850 [Paenibacillus cisolokensis]